MIDSTAQRYTTYIHKLRKHGFRIHIFNVVPTGDFLGPDADKWKKGLHYPFNTSYQERTNYTEQLNGAYASCCDALSIPFIDIYKDLVDEDGKRKEELVFDYAHLGNRCADLVMRDYFKEHTAVEAKKK